MPNLLTVVLAITVGLLTAPLAGAAQGYSSAPTVPDQKQVESLEDRILSQPEMMDAIRALQSDPDFQDVLKDPEVTRALESGNTEALLANPKVNSLVNNPAVQDITKKLGQ